MGSSWEMATVAELMLWLNDKDVLIFNNKYQTFTAEIDIFDMLLALKLSYNIL